MINNQQTGVRIMSYQFSIFHSKWSLFYLTFSSIVAPTLLDHCLKSLHNTVKHMNLPTCVKLYTICVKFYTSCVIFLNNSW